MIPDNLIVKSWMIKNNLIDTITVRHIDTIKELIDYYKITIKELFQYKLKMFRLEEIFVTNKRMLGVYHEIYTTI